MTKVSIDLPDPASPESEEIVAAVTIGCLRTLKRLGKIGGMIEVFRITHTNLGQANNTDKGPVITIYFRDPLGTKRSYETDYRFIGTGSRTPSAEEITDFLCNEMSLPRELREHLKNGERALDAATKHLASLKN